jgi:hypothetical protein
MVAMWLIKPGDCLVYLRTCGRQLGDTLGGFINVMGVAAEFVQAQFNGGVYVVLA